jgi:hypothetical protein
MSFRTCSYERELAQALKDGHWPDGCVPELRAHVEACANCSDLVLLTQTFQNARNESAREVLADSPSLLWWRAQLRRRNTAVQRVSRPITIAQTFALAVNLLVAVVLVASQYRRGLHWALWWQGITPARLLHLMSSTSATTDWNLLLLIPALGGLVLLSGLVLYVVSEKS